MSATAKAEAKVEIRSQRALHKEELALAQPFLGRVPWEMVAWGLGNFCFWLALFPLTMSGAIPLWAGFLLATFCTSICYLPSHEAQHSIIGAEGSKLRWLNELVGHVSTIPLVLPYRIAWITHRQHHAHANDPELDPDHDNKADTWWQSVWNGIKSRQPGADNAYKTVIEASDDPKMQRAITENIILNMGFYAVLITMAWSGYAIEAGLDLVASTSHRYELSPTLFELGAAPSDGRERTLPRHARLAFTDRHDRFDGYGVPSHSPSLSEDSALSDRPRVLRDAGVARRKRDPKRRAVDNIDSD